MTTVPVTFSYRSSTAHTVEVSGDWDSWTKRLQLAKVPESVEGDLWQITKQLPPSTKFVYKYIVNGDDWHVRQDLPVESDGHGNTNNVLHSPDKDHATSDDDQKEKTTADLVGATLTESFGAAIASVVGTNPFEGDKQAIPATPGLTASSDKQLNAAEQESAVLASGQGAPSGAAVAAANGSVPTQHLQNLGLADDKNPADAGAAAVAAAAAASTGAVAAGQTTHGAGIKPQSLETVQNAPKSTAPNQGTLDQSEAALGLGQGAASSGVTVGAPLKSDDTSAPSAKAGELATGAAAAGAAAIGAVAVAAATVSDKAKEAVANVQEQYGAGSVQNGATTNISQSAADEVSDTLENGTGVNTENIQPTTETASKQEQLSSGPIAASTTSPTAAPSSTEGGADPKTAAIASGIAGSAAAAGTAGASKGEPLSETALKQEHLSSGSTAASTDSPVAAPSRPERRADAKTEAIASGAAGSAAAAGTAGANAEAPVSETQAKQEALSSGPAAASTTSPSTAPSNSIGGVDPKTAAVAAGIAGAAAAGGTSAVSQANGDGKPLSETEVKQEALSSGPRSTAVGAGAESEAGEGELAGAAPALSQTATVPAGHESAATTHSPQAATSTAGVTPAAAVPAGAVDASSGANGTSGANGVNSSQPVAIPVGAQPSTPPRSKAAAAPAPVTPQPASNFAAGGAPVSGGTTPTDYETAPSGPSTPAKASSGTETGTIGSKFSSKFGSRRKSKDLSRLAAEGDESMEFGGNGDGKSAAEAAPERKGLTQRSRKKSFFGKIKEKLTNSPSK